MRLLLAPLLLASFACTKLTEPVSEKSANLSVAQAPVEKVAKPIAPAKRQAAAKKRDPDLVTASHILVSYQGAVRSQASRSKDEARSLASQLLARARKGEDFGELALAHSDDPTAKSNRGSLGSARASTWVKPFGDAALALRAGEMSDLVETPFGFHIIKREQ